MHVHTTIFFSAVTTGWSKSPKRDWVKV